MLYPRGGVKRRSGRHYVLYPEETQRRISGRHYMLYPRGDVKKKEREALHAIDPRKLKDDGSGSTTCYSPEER
jgi:hypothetical protein